MLSNFRRKLRLPLTLASALACSLGTLSPTEAGLIPWAYNAVFGYGPIFQNSQRGLFAVNTGGYSSGYGMQTVGYGGAPLVSSSYYGPSYYDTGSVWGAGYNGFDYGNFGVVDYGSGYNAGFAGTQQCDPCQSGGQQFQSNFGFVPPLGGYYSNTFPAGSCEAGNAAPLNYGPQPDPGLSTNKKVSPPNEQRNPPADQFEGVKPRNPQVNPQANPPGNLPAGQSNPPTTPIPNLEANPGNSPSGLGFPFDNSGSGGNSEGQGLSPIGPAGSGGGKPKSTIPDGAGNQGQTGGGTQVGQPLSNFMDQPSSVRQPVQPNGSTNPTPNQGEVPINYRDGLSIPTTPGGVQQNDSSPAQTEEFKEPDDIGVPINPFSSEIRSNRPAAPASFEEHSTFKIPVDLGQPMAPETNDDFAPATGDSELGKPAQTETPQEKTESGVVPDAHEKPMLELPVPMSGTSTNSSETQSVKPATTDEKSGVENVNSTQPVSPESTVPAEDKSDTKIPIEQPTEKDLVVPQTDSTPAATESHRLQAVETVVAYSREVSINRKRVVKNHDFPSVPTVVRVQMSSGAVANTIESAKVAKN